jgi:hypothetical protein
MIIEKPKKCSDCPYTTYYNGIRICGFPIHTRDELMIDVTSFKVPSDYVPNWCKIPDINNTYDSLSGTEKEAYEMFVKMALVYRMLNH